LDERVEWFQAGGGDGFQDHHIPFAHHNERRALFEIQPLTNGFGDEDLSFGRHMGGNETVYRFQLGDVYMIED